ncbi:MAG: family 16 glycosylhydrolase, partial [Rhodothermia bacterium]|nr:family 16 glycosylhydrolase [Rhodothermia bacterium]
LKTEGIADWTYGRFEARMKLPGGRGTWSAFWLLHTEDVYSDGGWPDNGEIDIVEHVGSSPDEVFATIHTNKYNGLVCCVDRTMTTAVADAVSEFHVYAVEWSPSKLEFFVDDVSYYTYSNEGVGATSWPYDQPFHIILNLAIGGTQGGQQGIDDSIFPAQLLVDYVRVFKRANATPTVSLTSPAEGAQFAPGGTVVLSADASDIDGAVNRVEFLQGGAILGEVRQPPYDLEVDNLATGCYDLSARVVDDEGRTATSDTVSVTVGGGCAPGPYLMRPAPIPGKIEAENYDFGGSNVAYRDADASNRGVAGFRSEEGVDVSRTLDLDRGYNVFAMNAREWLTYTVDVEQSGLYEIIARASSNLGSGTFRIRASNLDTTMSFTSEGSPQPQMWASPRLNRVPLEAGVQQLRIDIVSAAWRLNWLNFRLQSGTSVAEDPSASGFRLEGNYPNPFSRETRVVYQIPTSADVRIDVFDSIGRLVATPVAALHGPGRHVVEVDGEGLSEGVYFVRMRSGAFVSVRAMLIAR